MTKYIINAPDGKKIKVETDLKMTDRLANEILADAGYGKGKSGKKSNNWLLDNLDKGIKVTEDTLGVLSSLDRGITFGLGQKLAGLGGTDVQEAISEASAKYNKEHPILSTALEFAGTLKNKPFEAGVNAIKEAPNLAKTVLRSGVVNADLAAVDNLARADKDIGKDVAISGGIGTAMPVIGKAVSSAVKLGGEVPGVVGKIVDKLDSKKSEERIQNFLNKYGEGFGNIESIGIAARPVTERAQKLLDKIKDMYYNKAWRMTDGLAPADISNTVATIKDAFPHLSRGTQSKIKEFMIREVLPQIKQTKNGKVVERINTEQLNNVRSKFDRFVAENGLGTSKTEKKIMSNLYNALKEDFLNSVAINGEGQAARKAMEEAMDNFAKMQASRSDYQLLKAFNNDKKSASELSNQILNALSPNKNDSKKIEMLGKIDKDGAIKNATIRYLDDAKKFNKLSPKGKKFIYGDSLDEAEKVFNGSISKKIEGVINMLADKTSGTTVTPYMLDLIRTLINK